MPFYQSIADILSENRQDKRAVLSRTKQIIGALDGLGRKLSATVFLDPEFSEQQAKKLDDADAALPLFGVPLAHKELYGRFDEGAVWPNEGGQNPVKGKWPNKPPPLLHSLTKLGR